MTDQPTLGQLLRQLRESAALSQRALASQLGVRFQHISATERDLRPTAAAAILDAYAALAPSGERDQVRDTLYHLAGKLPPEIVTYLLADPARVNRLRHERGIIYPD